MFYNELDILTYRLNILNNVVDYFVIVEATNTHSGKEKQLFFKENIHMFKMFSEKIIHVVVEDLPYKNPDTSEGEQWKNEEYNRNCIIRGLNKLDILEQDMIIISDLDEIPDPNVLRMFRGMNTNIKCFSLQMDMYYYNLHSRLEILWSASKILSYKKFKELNISCSDIRKSSFPIFRGCGWHLSYFGDSTFIKNKIEMFAHQEFNTGEFTDTKKIEDHIRSSTDLFNRGEYNIHRIPIEENDYLPPEYNRYLKNFIIENL